MEQKNINYLILAFVFLIVGAALITAVATSTNDRTEKTRVAFELHDISTGLVNTTMWWEINEAAAGANITVTNVPSGWKIEDCPITNVAIYNSSTGTYTALTSGTDYNLFASTGLIQLLNTSTTVSFSATTADNNSYVSYWYCPDDYLNSTWGRTVLKTVPGFFALALLGIALWLFYSVFRNIGIIRS